MSQNRLRALSLAAASAFALIGLPEPANAQAQAVSFETSRVNFNIPAQNLASALTEFSRQSQIPMLVPNNLVRGLHSTAVSGEMTPSQALARITAGTELRMQQTPGGGLTLVQAGAPSPTRLGAATEAASSDTISEEVVVTGSLLRRPVSEQSHLITTVGAQDLEESGAGNAVEALRSVAQNQALVTSSTTFGTGTGFASFASLRSLGPSSTLVLFDSHRVAPNAFEGRGIDLNTIPLNMIERVETLADGASSIYGSDAIAGVINFIPRREMQGLSASVGVFMPEQEGGEKWNGSLAGGIGDLDTDGWNVYAGISYQDRETLYAEDRAFSARGFIPERGNFGSLAGPTFANWTQGGTVSNPQNPYAPNCPAPQNVYAPAFLPGAANNACFRNGQFHNSYIPAQTDQSFLINGSVRLGEHTASLQYFVAQSEVFSELNEFPVGGDMVPTGAAGVNPYFPGHALYPTGGPALPPGFNPNAPVQIDWRPGVFDPLATTGLTQTDRYLAQLKGSVLGWDYEAYALTSRSSVKVIGEHGFFNVAAVPAMLDGSVPGVPYINPFGPQSPAASAYINSIRLHGLIQSAVQSIDEFGAQVSRDLFELPAGAVQFALAASLRNEEAHFATTPLAQRAGLATDLTPTSGDRDVTALTSEVLIPVLENLELNLSLRYDDYSDFGSTTNPKVLATWRPMEGLSLRASYNEGFRAPTLRNLFTPVTINNGFAPGTSDPVLCPSGNPIPGANVNRDCGLSFAPPELTGGNLGLGPEESEAWSAGVSLQPRSELSFGLDYWRYYVSNTIDAPSTTAIATNLADFGSFMVRCSGANPAFASAPNVVAICATASPGIDPVAYIVRQPLNLGDTETSGIDFTATWRGPEIWGGAVGFDYRGTVVLQYDYQNSPSGPWLDRAGIYSDGYPVIDYSHFAALSWESDPLRLELSNRYLSGYQDCTCGIAPRKVESYSLWDLAASLHWPARATIIGRITNLFDEQPPYSNRFDFLIGADERFTDPIGRAYSLTVRYDF